MMNRILAAVGALAFSFVIQIDSAEAITKTYDVGGRRYTYETRDPLQVQAARKLIEAANAADAAKAKAEAERAANPLVRLAGSQAQTEAAQAQERLELAIAEHEKAATAKPRQPAEPKNRGASTKRPSRRLVAPAARQPAAPPDVQVSRGTAASANATRSPSAVASPRTQDLQPGVKAVFADAATGIRTTFMADGSIHEEPIESTAPSVKPERSDAGETTGSVKRLP